MPDPISTKKQDLDELLPAVYQELRLLARHYLALERRGHTLRATALVHEAYVRLARSDGTWKNPAALCAAATHAMRRILVDHARARRRQKRGCGTPNISIDEGIQLAAGSPVDLLELDEALERLAQHDPRKSKVIELLFFAGLTYDECATALEMSTATLHRELRMAKAWLCKELSPVVTSRAWQ
jgi:RNA polymerase sigma factor (TIGR02999 family)